MVARLPPLTLSLGPFRMLRTDEGVVNDMTREALHACTHR